MVKVLFTHSQINSGTAVTFDATSVSYGWKNILTKDPVPGKYDIVEVGFAGFENPSITVNGKINVWTTLAKTHSTNTGANAILDFEYLKDFATIKDGFTLTVPLAVGSLPGRPTAGYATGSTMVGSLVVRIEQFSYDLNAGDSQSVHSIPYNITLVESVR